MVLFFHDFPTLEAPGAGRPLPHRGSFWAEAIGGFPTYPRLTRPPPFLPDPYPTYPTPPQIYPTPL